MRYQTFRSPHEVARWLGGCSGKPKKNKTFQQQSRHIVDGSEIPRPTTCDAKTLQIMKYTANLKWWVYRISEHDIKGDLWQNWATAKSCPLRPGHGNQATRCANTMPDGPAVCVHSRVGCRENSAFKTPPSKGNEYIFQVSPSIHCRKDLELVPTKWVVTSRVT